MGRNQEPLSSTILYHFLKWSVIAPTFHTYFRGRIENADQVPRQGKLVIVSNHGSFFDPPFLATSMRRPVAFMAKEELFQVPILGQVITLYGAYPVNRAAADRSAIRSALAALEEGWATGLFLEGTRTVDGRIHQPKLGAATIAAKAQAPLLPVSLWGTEKISIKGSAIPRSVPLTIRVGDLIDPPPAGNRQALETVTQACADQINAMLDLGR